MGQNKQTKEEHALVRDLMQKVSGDVSGTILRVVQIAPNDSILPIGMAAGASVLGMLAGTLAARYGHKPDENGAPTNDTTMYAALLVMHSAIGSDDPAECADRDLQALKMVHADAEGK